MIGRRIQYSMSELGWIKRHCQYPRRSAHAEFCRCFSRTDVSLVNFNSLCKRKGWCTGRTGYFQKGVVPHNRGKRMPVHANSAQTQFKKGHLPHNTRYLGHERISKDGYVEVSIAATNPYTGFGRRYVLKHRYLWEREHGAVPAGYVLKCRDGNRLNTAPSNWMPVSRSLLPFLNGRRGPSYDQAHPDVRQVILMLARLKHIRFSMAAGRRARVGIT